LENLLSIEELNSVLSGVGKLIFYLVSYQFFWWKIVGKIRGKFEKFESENFRGKIEKNPEN
jgi:hypothetical protein